MRYKYIYSLIVIALLYLLMQSSCASKSKLPLSSFSKLEDVPQFNGTYLNLNSRLGSNLELKDPNIPSPWLAVYNTDLINLEYTDGKYVKISFWTENGLVEESYKAKKIENCIEITPKRTKLWIPAIFKDYRFRLRFGSDESNDLQLHIKEDNFAWFFIIVGGHEFDYSFKQNKLETMCKDTTMLIPYQINGKWGYQDCGGKTIFKPIYDFVRLFDEHGIARVKKDGLWGTINLEGKTIAPHKYTTIESYSDKMNGYKVYVDEDFGYMRVDGKEFILPQYKSPNRWEYNRLPLYIERNGKYGFIDSTGIVCPAILDKLHSDSWGVPATTNPTYGELFKVSYKNQKYYLSLDGYLYPYDHKFFKERTTLFYEDRIKVSNLQE